MAFRFILAVMLLMMTSPSYGAEALEVNDNQNIKEQPNIPNPVYSALDHLLSLSQSKVELDKTQLSGLIDFVGTIPQDSSITLNKRDGASGAFHAFSIKGSLPQIIDYAYNPGIPSYVTMPSSVQDHEWLTKDVVAALKKLPNTIESSSDVVLLRGKEKEAITPDTNTGGYYLYSQDRIVMILPGPKGAVLISATSQTDTSEVGKKGCVVGEDKDWNYLYSGEKGINKMGLGWVDSYMYYAYSVIVYVEDADANVVNVGSFKWLNAGWAKINMVKSSHILDGIKRFSSDFKAVLESPGLPETEVLESKYSELQQSSEEELRQQVVPYLQALNDSDAIKTCPSSFRNMVTSGEYLQQMSREEMVRVILLEYVKENIGKDTLISSKIQAKNGHTLAALR